MYSIHPLQRPVSSTTKAIKRSTEIALSLHRIVAAWHLLQLTLGAGDMAKKSKNAAAAAAEPPPKKSKSTGAAVCGAAEVAGGEGGSRGAGYRDAFQIGDEVGVSKFAGRPGALWRPATIVGIKEKNWPVVYNIKWGTTEKYGTPLRLSAHALD